LVIIDALDILCAQLTRDQFDIAKFLLTEIWRFNNFQNGGRPPPWILKTFAVFVAWPLWACRSASKCKISLKSDNCLISNDKKSDFQDGVHRHVEF